MKKAEIEHAQIMMNKFSANDRGLLAYVAPLIVDGKWGHATSKRVKKLKYYLGYPKKERNDKIGREFLWRLSHPKKYNVRWARPVRLAVAAKRRTKQRKIAREEHKKLTSQLHRSGYAMYDGKVVPAWTVPHLDWARTHKVNGRVWVGFVVSGVRTSAHSVQLCIEMCHARFCPGRCAGASSNHNMEPSQGEPHGALDVSDYDHFEDAMAACPLTPALRNDLPNDKVHFSATGH